MHLFWLVWILYFNFFVIIPILIKVKESFDGGYIEYESDCGTFSSFYAILLFFGKFFDNLF